MSCLRLEGSLQGRSPYPNQRPCCAAATSLPRPGVATSGLGPGLRQVEVEGAQDCFQVWPTIVIQYKDVFLCLLCL